VNNGSAESILCVIDFSKSSVETLKWAADMATRLNVSITILHPYRLNQPDKKEDMILVKKNIDRNAVENFKKIAENIFKDQHVSYDFHAEVGFVQDRVQEYVVSNNILFMVTSKRVADDNKESLHNLIAQVEVPLVLLP
jgi:hypothetical protein